MKALLPSIEVTRIPIMTDINKQKTTSTEMTTKISAISSQRVLKKNLKDFSAKNRLFLSQERMVIY